MYRGRGRSAYRFAPIILWTNAFALTYKYMYKKHYKITVKCLILIDKYL